MSVLTLIPPTHPQPPSVFTVIIKDPSLPYEDMELDRFPVAISPIGSETITTDAGCFMVEEAGIDYKSLEIHVYTTDYDLYD